MQKRRRKMKQIEDYYNASDMRYYNRPFLKDIPQITEYLYLGGCRAVNTESGKKFDVLETPLKSFFSGFYEKPEVGTLLELLRARYRGGIRENQLYLLERLIILGVDPNKIMVKKFLPGKSKFVHQGDSETFGCYESTHTIEIEGSLPDIYIMAEHRSLVKVSGNMITLYVAN